MGTAGSRVPGWPAKPPRAWQWDSGDGSQPTSRPEGPHEPGAYHPPAPTEPPKPEQEGEGALPSLPPAQLGCVLALTSPARSKLLWQLCRQIPAARTNLRSGGAGEAEVEKGLLFTLFRYSSANKGQATELEHLPAAPVLPGVPAARESPRSGVTASSQHEIKRQIKKKKGGDFANGFQLGRPPRIIANSPGLV